MAHLCNGAVLLFATGPVLPYLLSWTMGGLSGKKVTLRVEWVPREQNMEANALSKVEDRECLGWQVAAGVWGQQATTQSLVGS